MPSGPGGIFIPPPVRAHARQIAEALGQTTYMAACGSTPCDAASSPSGFVRFQGRWVDDPAGHPGMMVVSECRKPKNPANKTTYVQIAGYPAPGIPTRVRIVLSTPVYTPCFQQVCPDFELTWNIALQQYDGYSIPLAGASVVPVRLVPQFTGPSGAFSSWHFVFDTSCAPGGTGGVFVNVAVSCFYPMFGGSSAPLGSISSACCNGAADPNSSYTINMYGCTPSRYVGRHVGDSGGRKVFMVAECCQQDLCNQGVTCCNCKAVPTAWQFSVAGVTTGTGCAGPGSCLGYNGSFTIVYNGPGCPGGGSCCWGVPTSISAGACTPGSPWILSCSAGSWTLHSTLNEAVYVPQGTWKCFGPNVMVLSTTNGACATFPATITLTAA